LVTKEVAKAKKPVVAAKYHSLSQTCDKRIVSWNRRQGESLRIRRSMATFVIPDVKNTCIGERVFQGTGIDRGKSAQLD
jgi:hypothetical protein